MISISWLPKAARKKKSRKETDSTISSSDSEESSKSGTGSSTASNDSDNSDAESNSLSMSSYSVPSSFAANAPKKKDTNHGLKRPLEYIRVTPTARCGDDPKAKTLPGKPTYADVGCHYQIKNFDRNFTAATYKRCFRKMPFIDKRGFIRDEHTLFVWNTTSSCFLNTLIATVYHRLKSLVYHCKRTKFKKIRFVTKHQILFMSILYCLNRNDYDLSRHVSIAQSNSKMLMKVLNGARSKLEESKKVLLDQLLLKDSSKWLKSRALGPRDSFAKSFEKFPGKVLESTLSRKLVNQITRSYEPWVRWF